MGKLGSIPQTCGGVSLGDRAGSLGESLIHPLEGTLPDLVALGREVNAVGGEIGPEAAVAIPKLLLQVEVIDALTLGKFLDLRIQFADALVGDLL